MSDLFDYGRSLVEQAGKAFASGQIFAKVLTPNDDSGRHGVLIPTDAYSYFPSLPIPAPSKNATQTFLAYNSISACWATLAYKYYERYPERRITRLHPILNNVADGPRLLVFLYVKHTDGSFGYYFDCADSSSSGRFTKLFQIVFGHELKPVAGQFIVRPIDATAFSTDPILSELLSKFDQVREQGWIDTLREGDTGIGYTFESLLGIRENNDQTADFKGIEIKCKGVKEGGVANYGKINLFQAGPTWLFNSTARERLRILGKLGPDGLYACHSQVTSRTNNLGLLLKILGADSRINLQKDANALAYWSFQQLEKRLAEKHSRAAFIRAGTRQIKGKTQYSYAELVYCDKPSIERFVNLVSQRNIVFEFLMSEKLDGTVRNHGYPWRLIRSAFLEQLFAFQIKLR
jgi:hypothetical protein